MTQTHFTSKNVAVGLSDEILEDINVLIDKKVLETEELGWSPASAID